MGGGQAEDLAASRCVSGHSVWSLHALWGWRAVSAGEANHGRLDACAIHGMAADCSRRDGNRGHTRHLDCDPGTDDALAIFLALASPELSVLAVTVAGGNVGLEHTLRNALALVSLAGRRCPGSRRRGPAAAGAFVSETRVHGENGLGGVVLPPGGAAAAGLAATSIRRILREAAEPVTLIGIGPATNLALALTTEPALAARVAQIVLMSGAWAEGNVTPAAEFNAWSDPEALAILLACGRPVVFATLELTAQALMTPDRIAAWRGAWPGALPAGGVRHPGDGSAVARLGGPARRCMIPVPSPG